MQIFYNNSGFICIGDAEKRNPWVGEEGREAESRRPKQAGAATLRNTGCFPLHAATLPAAFCTKQQPYQGTSWVFALILDGPIRCRNLLRAVFFIPNIMSILVVGYIWRFVYTSALPDLMTAIGQKTVAVLGKPQSVIYAIALVGIWNTVGYYMVIYIASLQSVSEDLTEAARIDGANGWQVLTRIKLPLISPTIVTCIILCVASAMKTFELPWTMTSGGPAGASTTMVLKIYNTAFNANRTGYATAQSTILFVLIASISFVLNIIMRRREAKLQ